MPSSFVIVTVITYDYGTDEPCHHPLFALDGHGLIFLQGHDRPRIYPRVDARHHLFRTRNAQNGFRITPIVSRYVEPRATRKMKTLTNFKGAHVSIPLARSGTDENRDTLRFWLVEKDTSTAVPVNDECSALLPMDHDRLAHHNTSYISLVLQNVCSP
jgi:hypothetical protein